MMQVGLTNMGRNGFMNAIMQEEQDSKKIINTCEQLIAAGYIPETAINKACDSCNISFDSILSNEKAKIRKKVEEIYQSNKNSDKRKD